MHLLNQADEAVKSYRQRFDALLGASPAAPYSNPGPDNPVEAAPFLAYLNLDQPDLRRVIEECYPAARYDPRIRQRATARLRFWGWAALKGHDNLHSAYQALRTNPEAQRQLGFGPLPCYETLRCFVYELLTPDRVAALKAAILRDMKRLQPNVGMTQVQDCTPHEALRRDDLAPYNPHYKVKMHRFELRWDPGADALLADQFFHGNAHENRWANLLTDRLDNIGIPATRLTTDNGYVGFQNHAHHWRQGIDFVHKTQGGWVIDEDAARQAVEARFNAHWQHPNWHATQDLTAKLRFLCDHGSTPDREAVGRYLRDHQLTHRTPQQEADRKQARAQNEGLNAELKRLPLRPQRQGALWLLRRALACTLTLFLVQWNRLQHGATRNLCRTAYIT